MWYFTFGTDERGLQNSYVKIEGTFDEAREKMFEAFGDQWAFQYSEEQFLPQITAYNLEEL